MRAKSVRPLRLFLPVFILAAFASSSLAQVNVTTSHNDNARTGQNLQESILTTSNVNSNSFGKLFSQPVDGYIYAQPLYVSNVNIPGAGAHNVVYVATMNDSVYAFDADSNTGGNSAPLWKVNFTNPAEGITTVSTTDVGCKNVITTQIGILGTPVIDTVSGTMYLVARTKESGVFYQRLHALDITTGEEKFGGPVVIQASVPGTGSGSVKGIISFNPLIQNQHPALLLQNGLVHISWASHCDKGAYHGWLMAYDAGTLAQTAAWVTTANGKEGGIWQSGAGPAGDASFNTFVATGNGSFDVNTGGVDYAQSILKIAPPSDNTFSVLDYFTPFNALTYNGTDLDIGSGGVVLLPDQTGGPHVHLLVEGDKAGNIYLVDRDNMGHYRSTNNNQIVQYLPGITVDGMWSSPSWWNNFVYIAAKDQTLQAFTFNPTTGLLSTTPTSQSSKKFNYPGSTVSISSNGTSNGIVWLLDNATYANSTATGSLHAYKATNLASHLYTSKTNPSRDNPGPAVKFTIPTIANGKVYVPTQTALVVYGLLNGNSQ
jgi:putative pyrroloquinoline-quinone-binding quinoprotein